MPKHVFLLVALTMTAFAANSLLNRLALADGVIGPSSFALIRIISGAIALSGLVLWQDRRLFDLREISALSVGSLALYVLGFSFSYMTLDAGAGALILFGGVQVTMFVGAILARETVPSRRWLGAAVALAGLAYLLRPSADAPSMSGALLMAAAALGWGVYSLKGRHVTRPMSATGANFLLATPIAIIVWLAVPDNQQIQTVGVVLAILSGAVTSGLGYALWYWVLPRLDASIAGVAQLTVPVIATIGGMIFLGEPLTLHVTLASIIVLGGVALSLRR